jgi:hypothetical protein
VKLTDGCELFDIRNHLVEDEGAQPPRGRGRLTKGGWATYEREGGHFPRGNFQTGGVVQLGGGGGGETHRWV